jgi:ribosomal protein L40E
VIIGIWVLSIVAAGAIDGAKGNSVIGGVMWAVFFGPFGILVPICWPAKMPPAAEVGKQALCIACRSYVPTNATKCRYCASDIRVENILNGR